MTWNWDWICLGWLMGSCRGNVGCRFLVMLGIALLIGRLLCMMCVFDGLD